MEGHDNKSQEIFSKILRAGRRTYFFDVKATKGDDYYLTITESKKKFAEDGKFHFEKHKLFLYKEDFEKFTSGLKEAVNFIEDEKGVYQGYESEENSKSYKTEVQFDDLVSFGIAQYSYQDAEALYFFVLKAVNLQQ